MSEKKNVLTYFVILISALLNSAMIIGRICYYTPSLKYDINKVCLITGIPVLLVLLFFFSGAIARLIRRKKGNRSGCNGSIIYRCLHVASVIILMCAGIAGRIYFSYNCHSSYINDIASLHKEDAGSLYSYVIRPFTYITEDGSHAVICTNIVLSVILMLLLYLFSRKVMTTVGGCIVLLLAAVSPYGLAGCIMYSPDLLYAVLLLFILTIFTYGYNAFKVNNTRNIHFTLVIIVTGILCGLFLLATPVAVPLILSLFLFTRFRLKDILQSVLLVCTALLIYFGLVHMDMYIVPVSFIYDIHRTAYIMSGINLQSISVSDCWNNFMLLCKGQTIYNNYILNSYIEPGIWMFLNITAVTGSLLMLKRRRSYNQLLMELTIFTVPLCLIIPDTSECHSMFYALYPMFVCMAGYAIYNIYCRQQPDAAVHSAIQQTGKALQDNNGINGLDNINESGSNKEPGSIKESDNINEPDSFNDSGASTAGDNMSGNELYNDRLFSDKQDDNPDIDIPEPIKISDIIPDTPAYEETAATYCTYDNNDIDNLLPVPKQLVPYGIPDNSITVHDYQDHIKENGPHAQQWEDRRKRAQNKSKHYKE